MSKQNTFLRPHVPTLFLRSQPRSHPSLSLITEMMMVIIIIIIIIIIIVIIIIIIIMIIIIVLFVESVHTVRQEDIKYRSSADFIDFIFTANRNQPTYNTAVRI